MNVKNWPSSISKRWPQVLALLVLGGAGATLHAAAQVISDPLNLVCVATANETCVGSVAVSNGGGAFGVAAVSNGGTATGLVAIAPSGVANTNSGWVGLAPGGQSYGFLSVGTGPEEDSGDGIVVNPTGPACATDNDRFANVVVAGTGDATTCPNPGTISQYSCGVCISGTGRAESDGGLVAVAISGTGPSATATPGETADPTLSVAVSPVGEATGSTAAVSGTGVASGPGYFGTQCPPQSYSNAVAVSATGNACAGVLAVSLLGSAYACGGPVPVAFVPGQLANQGGSASVCQGSIPLPKP